MAILSAVSSEGLEESLAALRRLRRRRGRGDAERVCNQRQASDEPRRNWGRDRRGAQRPQPMTIVVDTNVLVSGLLNPYGAPGQIVNLIAAGELSLAFDARILGEYRNVLLRPAFSFRLGHVHALLERDSLRRPAGRLARCPTNCPTATTNRSWRWRLLPWRNTW